MLVKSPGKFLLMIWNVGTKTYPKFVTLCSFLKIFKNLNNWKNSNGFWKINKFIFKKNFRSHNYLWDKDFFQFVSNFSAFLLCKKYIFFFTYLIRLIFFRIFVISRNTEIRSVLAGNVYVKHPKNQQQEIYNVISV